MSKLVQFLAAASGLTESDVRRIVIRAPISYKHYFIEKRTGGQRLISQPAREVKALQRLLVARLCTLPVHNAATAYRQGCSIRHNAERHAANGPIMKFDFKNFFPSIRSTDWEKYAEKRNIFSMTEDVELSSRLLFMAPRGSSILRLAIGAPSSPWLSNVLMYEFDERISAAVAGDSVTYSRYADDLTFSARRTGYLTVVEGALRKVVHDIKSPSLVINEKKTLVATTKYRRVVTGLVLADDGRVTIGRDRKRLIRATLHHAFNGKNTKEENSRLAGMLAFAGDVEPTFLDLIKKRYGADVIKQLLGPSVPTIPE
jgi:RNA-directed DNA polymerase